MAETAGPVTDRPPTGPPRVDLLGAVAVHGPGGRTELVGRPQVQATLAFLLIERRPVGQGELADLLWGERALSPHWKGAVRGVLSKVRDVLTAAGVTAEVVAGRDGTVRLQVPADLATDVELATAAVDGAERALAVGARAEVLDLLAPWADHLQQHLLPAGDGSWVRTQQDRLADLARRATSAQVSALIDTGRPDLAAERARAWVRAHPLDEAVHEQLIAALVRDGRRWEATDAYRELARVLADELGVGPSERVTALVGNPMPATRTPTLADARPPTSAIAQPIGADGVFLGRRDELDELQDAWAATLATGAPQLVVISGKSGIGKTRLAQELARHAADDGAAVRWARCVPGEPLPFEPLASAVAPTSGRPIDQPAGTTAPTADPATARVRALQAIDTGVRSLAAGPAVLVIDDLQWASDDLAAALEQTLAVTSGPLLLVVTCRNLPAGVHEVLARLQRSLPTTHVGLRGLDQDDLLPLFDPSDADRAVAGAGDLHRRTGGHPFFVSEVAIAPWRAGRPIDPDDIPDAVRDWIGHRADALPKPLRARLDLASVMGDECATATVARCAHVDADVVLDDLEALVDEGFLVETGRIDVFAFPHLITRDAVYERIGATRRARMHAAVADALAASAPVPGRHAAIARHLRAAGPDRATEAGQELLAAGREALDAGAWSQAELRFREAGDVAPDDPAIRASALTGIARSLHLQRRRDEAEALIDEALAVARAHRLPLAFAEAALVLVGRAGRGATQRLSDLEQAELLREALAGITELERARDGAADPSDSADPAERRAEQVRLATLACQLEGELAQAVSLTAPSDERRQLAERAVARAQAIDPPDTHLTARALLISRLARLDPADVPKRLDDLDQVLAIAPSGRSVDATLAALTYRHEDLALVGRREESRRALEQAVALAEQSQHPYWTWAVAAWTSLGALMDGDLDEAERLAVVASSLQGPDEGGALACLGVNLVDIRLYQGRSGEVLDLLAGAADASPHIPCYRAVLALCAAAAGEDRLAADAFAHFHRDGFSAIPEDTNRLLALTVLADTAVRLDDRASAAELRTLLLPASGLQAILNCYGGGGAYWGPVAHQLGRLAAVLGHRDEADDWFAQAEASARAMEAPLALARITEDPVRSAHR